MHKSENSNENSEEAWQTDDSLERSFNITKTSSNFRNVLRKEDTFIVSDKRQTSGYISPAEDLKRIKAMVLARANASFALKNMNNHHVSHKFIHSHYSSNNGRDRRIRPHLVSTGAEVSNDRGEKIFFHWKESESPVRNGLSRAPAGVRKLYQYKMRRLRHKQSLNGSNSAPDKKIITEKLSSFVHRTVKVKRSQTADITPGDQGNTRLAAPDPSKDFQGSEKTRLKSRVAFADKKNEDLKDDRADKKQYLSRISENKSQQTRTQANRSDNGNTAAEHMRSLPGHTKSLLSSTTSSDADVAKLAGQNIPVQSGWQLSSSSSSVSRPHATDHVRESKVVPCEQNNNVLVGLQLKSRYPERNGLKNNTLKGDITNNTFKSNMDMKNNATIYDLNSPVNPTLNHRKKPQPQSPFKSKTEVIMTSVKPDSTDSHEVPESNLLLNDIDSLDNDTTGKRQMLDRNTSTDGEALKSGNSEIASTTSAVYGTDRHGQANVDRSPRYYRPELANLQTKSHEIKNSVDRRITEENIITLNDISVHGEDSSTDRINDRNNLSTFSDNCTVQRVVSSNHHVHSSQDTTTRARLIKSTAKDHFPNVFSPEHEDRVIKVPEELIADCYLKDVQGLRSKVSNSHDKLGHCPDEKWDIFNVPETYVSKNLNSFSNLRETMQEVPVEFPEKSANPSSHNPLTKFNLENVQSKSCIHEQTKAKTKARDGNKTRDPGSDHVYDPFTDSSDLIDHRFANKCDRRGIAGGASDRKKRFDLTRTTQGAQSCVTVSKLTDSKVAGHVRGWAQQDTGVSIATSQVNKTVATSGESGQLASGINCSLMHQSSAENELNHQKHATHHNGPECNNLSETLLKSELTVGRGSNIHTILTGGIAEGINIIKDSHIQEIGDKHVHDVRNVDRGSIANSAPVETLNLEIVQAERNESTETPPPSINRYKYETNLQHQKSKSESYREKSETSQDVPVQKTKKLPSYQKNKRKNTNFISGSTTKENIQETNRSGENSNGPYLARSVNSISTVQERRGNRHTCEEDSIECSESINAGRVIHDSICTGAASTGGVGYAPLISEDFVNRFQLENRIKAGANIVGYTRPNRKPTSEAVGAGKFKATAQSVSDTSIQKPCYGTPTVCTGNNGSNSVVTQVIYLQDKDEQTETRSENVKYLNSQEQEKLEKREKKIHQRIHQRTKDRERTRQTICLHTQNMEFIGLPEKKEALHNADAKHLMQASTHDVTANGRNKDCSTGSVLTGINSHAENQHRVEKQNENHKGIIIYHKEAQERPRSPELSAYTKYKNEDLWSVNDDDDEDDQIQFIDGEQDFYEVFGYDEETVAILKATKVYPVSSAANSSDFSRKQDCLSRSTNIHEPYVSGEERNDSSNHAGNNCVEFSDNRVCDKGSVTGTKINVGDDCKKNGDVLKRTSHTKLALSQSDPTSKGIKPPDKLDKDSKEVFTTDNGYLNIYRKNSNHVDLISPLSREAGQPLLSKEIIVNGGFTKDEILHSQQGNKLGEILHSQQRDKPGEIFLLKGGKHSKRLASKHRGAEPTAAKHQDNSGSFPNQESGLSLPWKLAVHESGNSVDPPEGNHYNGRKELLNEENIPETFAETSQTQPLSDNRTVGNLSVQTGNTTLVREAALLTSKDQKSHVALRNKLATERHISQTRYHRHINNSLADYQKNNNILQISPLNESRNNRQESTEARQVKSKDSINTAQLKYTEDTLTTRNPYLQAADRIMSRFSDTENSICSRSDINNSIAAHNRLQAINSPLRRMSHPVDSRSTHAQNPGSYLVAKPRKLKPITQLPDIKHNQQFSTELG